MSESSCSGGCRAQWARSTVASVRNTDIRRHRAFVRHEPRLQIHHVMELEAPGVCNFYYLALRLRIGSDQSLKPERMRLHGIHFRMARLLLSEVMRDNSRVTFLGHTT